jgi:hypothetical protein
MPVALSHRHDLLCPRVCLSRRWLTRCNVILLSIPPLLVLLLVLTNDLYHLMWLRFAFDGSVQPLRGMGNWILLGYGWSLVLVNITVFIWLFIRSPQHCWPVALIVFGHIMGRGLYTLDTANRSSVAPLDPLILAVLFPITMYALALFGFRIFDPLPAARCRLTKDPRFFEKTGI